jgi:hypothetical protein
VRSRTALIAREMRKIAGIPWIARASGWALAALVAGCATGCTADGSDEPDSETNEGNIFGGMLDDDGAAKAGVVALRVGNGPTFELCSGALIAPNVVLTARHCVSKNVTDAISCDENGLSMSSAVHVAGNEDPASIAIYLGASPSFSKTPVAVVQAVIAPEGDILCDSDIALVVLDRRLQNIEPFAVRFGAPARVGETIRAVGYGKNDASTPMGTRFRKENVPVLAVGSGITPSKTRLGPREFEVGRSICEGDSGGPAISELTGAVIGVVSRGGPCGDNFGHVYTTTAGFDSLFDRAFAAAGGAPLIEANTPPANMEAEPRAIPSDETTDDLTKPAISGCALGLRGSATSGRGFGLALTLVGLLMFFRGRRPRTRA